MWLIVLRFRFCFLYYGPKLVGCFVLLRVIYFEKQPVYQIFNVRKHLIVIAISLLCTIASAQDQSILLLVDSLKAQIPAATDTSKYNLTFKVAYELFDVNNQEAVLFAKQAFHLSLEIGDSLKIAKSGRLFGQLLRRVDKPDEAISQFLNILPVAERNHFVDEQKRILNALAVSYLYKAIYDKALEYNFRSLEIREREGNQKEISLALMNIGLVYYKMIDYEQAIEYNNRALEIKEKTNDTELLDDLLINMSLCYVRLKEYNKAQEFVNRGFRVCKGDCSDIVKVQGEYCLGVSFLNQNKYDVAASHFEKSYFLSKKIEDKRFQAENLYSLAEIELRNGKYEEAEKKLNETESLSRNAGYNQILINTYFSLSTLYNRIKDYQKASIYQSKYIHLKDSIYSEDLIKNLAKVQSAYLERVNLKTIDEQNDVLKLKEQVIAKVRAQYFFILTIAILSLLLTFVFVRFNRIQQRTNVELAKAKREIESKNQVLELTNAELDARVNERTEELNRSNKSLQHVNDELDNFIYKTSHDIRGPLASLKGITNVAMLDVKDSLALDYLKKLDSSAEKLNTILTRLVIVNHINHATLHPERIDFKEMVNDILVLEKKKGIPHRMTISCDIQPEAHLISDKSVLRLAVENLIDNAIKFYSDTDRLDPFVKIEIQKSEASLVEIRVIDNGIGIQEDDQQKLFQMFMRASERSETGGIGLYLAKLATEKVAGQISFSVLENKLTCFSISLPSDLNKVIDRQKREDQQRLS